MVHATGIMGFVHSYYLLELRAADGWAGFGTHIHEARFRRMGTLGEPMLLSATATQVRRIRGTIVARYRFEFRQAGELVYTGDQTAMFTRG